MMNLEKGYKQTEVGIIPEDWEVKQISDVFEFSGGSQPPRSTFVFRQLKNYIRLIQIRDYKSDKFETYIPQELAQKKCTEEDIMIGRYGPPIFQILSGIQGAYNVALIKAIPKVGLDKKFGLFFLKQDKLFAFVEKLSQRSSGQTGVNLNQLKLYQFPLPPLSEQTAIASALSDMDQLIAKTEQVIEKKKAIKQGVMQELLKPKEGWVVKKLGDFGKTYGGITGKSKADFGKGDAHFIPFMNIMGNPVIDTEFLQRVNIKPGEIQNKVQKGDLFFNGSSETPEEVGLCSVLDSSVEGLYLNSFCFGYRTFKQNELNGHFLAYYFRSPLGRNLIFSLAQGATRYNLSKTNLLKLELPIPSFREQETIASILIEIDEGLRLQKLKLQKLKLQKQGMMQALLTGKIRLV